MANEARGRACRGPGPSEVPGYGFWAREGFKRALVVPSRSTRSELDEGDPAALAAQLGAMAPGARCGL
jgi:hypothetical protein